MFTADRCLCSTQSASGSSVLTLTLAVSVLGSEALHFPVPGKRSETLGSVQPMAVGAARAPGFHLSHSEGMKVPKASGQNLWP